MISYVHINLMVGVTQTRDVRFEQYHHLIFGPDDGWKGACREHIWR